MTCRIILLALFIRVLIALATRTFFQPDEYFQSLEVAHHLAFGYGRLTWEWLAQDPIRSIFYPAINAPIYFALKQLKLDNTRWLIWGPKILHGVLASGTDIALARLTRRVLGEKYVTTAIFLSLTSVFHGLALSRSLSNSLETTFTTIALSFLPWDFTLPGWRNELQISLQFAAFACAVRPTSAVIWIYIFPLMLWQQRRNIEVITVTFTKGLFMGVLWCWFMFILDSNYFGKPTFTALNFLRANLSSISLFYGANSWHYYFTQAIPILCTTTLPFVLHGAWLASRPDGTRPAKVLLGLTAWTVLIYSLAGHKEWRFIHPLLPIMHIFAAKSLVDSFTASIRSDEKDPRRKHKHKGLPVKTTHMVLIVSALPLLFYLMFFHGRAQIDVMYYLRNLEPTKVKSVGFLMPCHSTPWQAYLHNPSLIREGRLWALGCEPPLQGQNLKTYRDQTDIFYENPTGYMVKHFPIAVDPKFPPSLFPSSKPGEIASKASHRWRHEWPQYLILFGSLLGEPGFQRLLQHQGYHEVWKAEYGWEGDIRRQGGVKVWKHNDSIFE